MSKIIIYDNKNILIAELDGKVVKEAVLDEDRPQDIVKNKYTARFNTYKLVHSNSLQREIKKIEKIFKYHKEK